MPKPLNILIVEDSADDADLLVAILKKSGYEPHWKCVETEQDYLANLKMPLDMILSDFSLPQFSATNALKWLQESRLEIPFIIVSGTIGEERAVESMKAGATDYVLKNHLERLGPVIERALRESKERAELRKAQEAQAQLAGIVRGMNEACFALDKEWGFTFVNDRCETLFGHRRDEMLGHRFWEVFSKLAGTPMEKNYRRAMTERVPVAFEAFSPIAKRWLDIRLFPSGDGLAAFLLDIDERKRAEEAQSRLAAIVNSSDDAIISKTLDGVITSWNKGAEKIFGYSAEDAIGKPMLILFPPGRMDEEKEILSWIVRGETVQHFETLRIRKDRKQIHVSVSISPITDSDGKIIGASKIARDITERKQGEEALRNTHAQLRQLLEHSPAVIYSLKIDGAKLIPKVASENITALLGYTVEEALSYEWWHGNLHPEDRDRAVAGLTETMTQGTSVTEYRMRHKDGTYRWVEDKQRLVRDTLNQPDYLVGIWADISERRHAEEALRKVSRETYSRKNTRVLVDLAVILGLGAVAEVIANYTDAFELLLEKLVLKFKGNLDDLFVPMGIALTGLLIFSYRRWRDAQSRVTEQANIQETLRKLHGELEKRIQQRTVELANANDSLRTEITGHKRAQENLIEKTAFLEAQTNSTMDAILVVNSHGKIILKNHRLNELFEIPDEIARDDDDAKTLRHALGLIKGPEPFIQRVQYLYEHPEEIGRDEIMMLDGRILERYSSPVRDKAGKYYGRIWSFRDITQSRKLEEQLRQSQKMEAVGQLASGVAHDFNNILAVIQMQSDLLMASEGSTPVHKEYADEIGAAATRAAALTRQLLLFSRKQAAHLRDVDLNESINNMTKMLRRTIGEDIQMQFKFAMKSLHVRADPGMLDQVLMNLAVNARDAMAQGGQLVIETSAVEFDETAALQSAKMRPGSFVCLSVNDTGCGIAPENLARIFEPFYTTKEVGKGTGLGLATVFGIIQQHQGWVNVYSEIGQGTTFRIYLPRLAKAEEQKPETLAAAPALPGGNETILLVEDDPYVRKSAIRTLSGLGYQVLEATNGAEALEVWKLNRDKIRLVLTDMVMPGGMTGKDLGEQLRKENPGLKLIYASGYSAEVVEKGLAVEEGVDFLTKPFSTAMLAKTIRARLDS
jgi:PAS domain S-box-containing protein